MNAMLVAIFVAVGLGVVLPTIKGRWSKLTLLIPIVLTVAYLVRPQYLT
jgi:hypothetical protein